MEDNSSGKESNYNEASFQMQRIDRSRQIISEAMINLLQYEYSLNKYHYEIVIIELLNLGQEIKGKLADDERKDIDRYRTLILDLLEFAPPNIKCVNYSIGNKVEYRRLDIKNWRQLRNLIFMFYDFIVDMLEKHEFSSPNKDNEELWD